LLFRFIVVCLGLLAMPGTATAAITMTGPASIGETAGTATYTVTCGGTLTDVGVLTVSVDPGPATAATEGEDYELPSGLPITCVPLVASQQTIDVPITNDGSDETTENFTVSAGPTPALAVATSIVDDDPIASITPVAFIIEGDSGTQAVELVVTLASAAVQTTTIGFGTENLSATAGPDYTATSGDVIFQPGESSKTISVPVVGDTTPEAAEGFFVNLLDTDNGSLAATAAQGGVGIFDNDKAALPTVSLARKSVSVEEGNSGTGNLLFDVTLSSAATQRTVVAWKTGDWTAKAGDYDGANGKVVFQAGQKSKNISVDVKGDRRDEPDEAFTVALSNPVAATLGATKAAFGVIADDDGPKVRISKPRVRGKNLVTKVSCPAGTTGCKGKLKGKVGQRKLRRARFDLEKGEATKLKVKLSRGIREALEDSGRRAKLVATATDPSGDTRRTRRRARLPQQ
jgi:hypothetical protein